MKQKFIKWISCLAVLLMIVCNSFATNYYVDPVNGSMVGDGSVEDPWSTLAEVFLRSKVFEAGDTIFLLSGHHGTVTIKGTNSDYVTILPLDGHNPTFKKVIFNSAKKWKLFGVTVSPETAPSYARSALIEINGSASENIIDSCFAYSVLDNSPWSKSDWVSNSCYGASVGGSDNIISNNHFLNVDHGILVSGQRNQVRGNLVENFAGDGMRGLGNFNVFEYNTIKNCYDVDGNHDDGFQAYTNGPGGVGTGTIYGIVLRGNTILNYTDENQTFRGTLQGIGCFDGMFEDWIIENNVVITQHWHGITLLGARNCRIINNTVVARIDETPGPPWIRIGKDKDGTLGTGNVIQNNLTTSLSNDAGIGTVDYNIIVSNYDDFFVDYEGFDLHLIEGCTAIDAGTDNQAPYIDKDGNARPQGAGYDVGAYEFLSGPDETPPLLSSISSIRPNEIEIIFNERLDETTALTTENYSIDNDVTVSDAEIDETRKIVTLTVENLVEDIEFTLTVRNIKDLAGNTIESNSSMAFEHICGYVTAIGTQDPNYPENTLDGNLDTRWSAEGVKWIKFDLCEVHTITSLEMAFYYGDTRTSDFFLEVSLDNENWKKIFDGSSSGTTAGLESIEITEAFGRWVKITGTGNSKNDWNSYTEVVIGAHELAVSKAELTDSLSAANEMYDSEITGADEFLEIIDSSQAVIDDSEATQSEINLAFAVLIEAMEVFRENKTVWIFNLRDTGVKVYPNPFNAWLNIELADGITVSGFSLIDIAGRRFEYSVVNGYSKFNTGDLSPGVYILQLITNKGLVNKKIIKQSE